MFKNLFDKINSQKEISQANKRTRLENFENNTPGIKVIADTVIKAIVNPASGIVQNMRNTIFAQYLLFTKNGMKHIVMASSGVDIKKAVKETSYNFTFAELGKNPLKQQEVEMFKDLIKMKLSDYPWMKVTNAYIHTYCMDALSSASIAIEKSGTTEIPESFWGNDIKF